MSLGWIGVDLDGTLAEYKGWNGGEIGRPVPAMLARVRDWLDAGKSVRIFTARVSHVNNSPQEVYRQIQMIDQWCLVNIGKCLPITCEKDYMMIELWDDRCHPVETNTGRDLLSHDTSSPGLGDLARRECQS